MLCSFVTYFLDMVGLKFKLYACMLTLLCYYYMYVYYYNDFGLTVKSISVAVFASIVCVQYIM